MAHTYYEKRGQPSKFTPETRQKIYDNLAKAYPYKYIAQASGISAYTLQRWLARARGLRDSIEKEEIDYDTLSDEDKDYVAFIIEFDKVESELLEDLLGEYRKSDKKWLLNKRFREDYSEETNLNINAKVETVLTWKDIVKQAENEE